MWCGVFNVQWTACVQCVCRGAGGASARRRACVHACVCQLDMQPTQLCLCFATAAAARMSKQLHALFT